MNPSDPPTGTKLRGRCSKHIYPKHNQAHVQITQLPRVFIQLNRNTGNMFSISFRKFRDKKKVYFDHQNINSLCLHHHYLNSSCQQFYMFLLSKRNPIIFLNQSAQAFALGYFQFFLLMCSSKKYQYLPHGREFFLSTPTPLEILFELHTFL